MHVGKTSKTALETTFFSLLYSKIGESCEPSKITNTKLKNLLWNQKLWVRTSTQPVNWFDAFHLLWPCRTNTSSSLSLRLPDYNILFETRIDFRYNQFLIQKSSADSILRSPSHWIYVDRVSGHAELTTFFLNKRPDKIGLYCIMDPACDSITFGFPKFPSVLFASASFISSFPSAARFIQAASRSHQARNIIKVFYVDLD